MLYPAPSPVATLEDLYAMPAVSEQLTTAIPSIDLAFARSTQSSVLFSGVAAGDATEDSVILWTRTADPSTKQGTVSNLTAQISTDPTFKFVPFRITGTTNSDRDYTLKLNISGLESGTQYYYRFQTKDGQFSPIGTFKTAPDPTEQVPLKFAFSGDADGQWRPYGSIGNLDTRNLDFFVFLGDTIYETKSAISPATGDPLADPVQALQDYHRKYRENLESVIPNGFTGLQELYSSQGSYVLLDNHELGNKQFINGGAPAGTPLGKGVDAKNSIFDVNTTGTFINQTPGFQALLQAYNDYQPIRERFISAPDDPRTDGTQQLYFAQQWGANSLFVNVDDRSYRDIRIKTLDSTGAEVDDLDPVRSSTVGRTMLGQTQLSWLKETLLDAEENGVTWKFVAISSPIDETSLSQNGKAWTSYRAERDDLLKFIDENDIENVVFLTTDDHQTRISELEYLADLSNPNSRVRVPNVFTIVAGPIGAGGPDAITDHSYANIQKLTDQLVTAQRGRGITTLGLSPDFPGLSNVFREGNPDADINRDPINFYSPDTFGYVTLDVSADGKTLSVNAYGINSYAANTFPEPNAANPIRRILRFDVNANTQTSCEPVFQPADFSIVGSLVN